jgi:hypothetical protein
MAAPQLLRIKQGDAFRYVGQAKIGAVALDCTGWGIASQIRSETGLLLATLDAEWTEAGLGLYRLRAPSETTGWQPGRYSLDIELTSPAGERASTPTVPVLVEPDNTRV